MRLGKVLCVATFVAGTGFATVINFDNLAAGVAVTNQYSASATFSSVTGEVNATTAQDLGSSLPNFICTAPVGGSIDCTHDVFVDFTNPVNNLTFLAVGVNNVGVVAEVNVFENGSFFNTVNIIGAGTPFTPLTVNLSAFSNVTRIEIVNDIDAAGIGYDDFSFGAATGVPEPSTFGLLAAGLGAAAFLFRKQRL